MKNLLIEGWRGVNHSFALVNQCQILELLKVDGLRLFHRDLPFAMAHWNAKNLDAGFSAQDRRRIEALAEPDAEAARAIDVVYRITSPFRVDPARDIPTVTFMVTEMGLSERSFEPGCSQSDFFTRGDNLIVTPTRWSRDRLVEHGFDAGKLRIIPHGVRSDTFYPLSAAERAASRAGLGIQPGEVVFLNLGAALWNKGVDALLLAFARLRQRHAHLKLILKDQRGLYGMSVDQTIQQLSASHPALFTTTTLAAVQVVPGNLSQAQLRLMYGVADCYVSPYRAEGFNLPVLEAIACGTPAVVTDGGATDDFCDADVALRVASTPGTQDAAARGAVGRFREPDAEALVEAMHAFCTGTGIDPQAFEQGRQRLVSRLTWHSAAQQLHEIFQTQSAAAQRRAALAPAPAPAPLAAQSEQPPQGRQMPAPTKQAPAKLGQANVLDLLKMIRPWTMRSNQKVRVGNAYDGGYVLPAAILNCDAVVSIGVGHDVSFDLALAQRGAKVLQYDHTVEGPPQQHDNFRFHKLGWGTRTQGAFISFDDIHAELKALDVKHPMLKFDIEGAEYAVLEATSVDDLADYEIIACEVHDFDKLADPVFFAGVQAAFEKLNVHHVPIHLHANNYQSLVLVEGVPIPKVLEVAFLRRDLDSFPSLSSDPIPGPLDRPNHPLRADICMNPF